MAEAFERLGEVLSVLRTRRGWTKRELAGRAGCGEGVLSRYESGERQPRLSTLSDLLTALDAVAFFELDGVMYNLALKEERDVGDHAAGVDLERLRREVEDLGRRLDTVETTERQRR